MAEALGVAASIIAVIQISEQVAAAYKYFTSARDTKNDILAVLNAVSGLKNVLDHLHSLIEGNSDSQLFHLPHLSSLDEPLKACEVVLERLGSKLGINVERPTRIANIKLCLPKRLMSVLPTIRSDPRGYRTDLTQRSD